MTNLKRRVVLCCVGTRPEAIKMAPVIKALQKAPWADCRVLVTAQHREMLDHMLAFFGISADIDLDIMTDSQRLPRLTARLVLGLDRALARETPDIVLAQGDTTTVLCTALASFYRGILFGHVEAGLRSGDLRSPFPEEANRILASRLASLHFAPTARARENLVREGVRPDSIHITGNTVIDALLMTVDRNIPIGVDLNPQSRLILVTAHRRESLGQRVRSVCKAINILTQKYPDVAFLWPVHPNPSVKLPVEKLVGHNPRVHVCEPLEYGPFVTAMRRSHLILTDSGGIQEEGPALGKPVLVMRDTTERPEAIHAGVARLTGIDTQRIVAEASRLLDDPVAYEQMSSGASLFGDGDASRRIVAAVEKHLGISSVPEGTRDPMAAELHVVEATASMA